MNGAASFMGMKMVESPIATKRQAVITRTTVKKRRRGWVLKYEQRPAAFLVGGGAMVVHPKLMRDLRAVAVAA